jgi:hypothetical protein
LGSCPTVPVKACVIPRGSNALDGVTEAVIAETVTVVEAFTALAATEVAMTVTVKSLDGGVVGAV